MRRSRAVLAATAFLIAVAACGGSDSAESTNIAGGDLAHDQADDQADDQVAAAATPIPDPTDIVIPTSTPLPTPTPLPTSTPLPLTAPTPSAILLGSAFTNSSKVTTVGIDEVFFGTRPADAAEAASTEWLGGPVANSNCYKIAPASGPQGIDFWVVDGFIERVEVEHPDLRTPSQLGVGNTLDELQGQLGERLTHETLDDGTVVATFAPSDAGDRDFRLIFELVDDSVVRYRSGRVGIVEQATESCPSTIGEPVADAAETTDPEDS